MKSSTFRASLLGAGALALAVGLPSAALADNEEMGSNPEACCFASRSGFFLEPEVVFERLRDSRLDYSISGTDVNSVETGYDAGWRLGLGWRFANHWDITVRGFHIDSQDDGETTGSQAATLSKAGSHALDALADVDLRLETGDVEIGRVWGGPNRPWARAFFGPRYLRYRQDQFVAYTGGDFGVTDATADTVEDNVDADAWGIRAGVEAHVCLGSGWSFFGWGAISNLVGNFDTFHEEINHGVSVASAATSDSFSRSVMGTEVGLGFDWLRETPDFAWGFRFGYELSNWTDLVASSADGRDAAGQADLGMEGGFLRFSLVW